MVKTEAFPTIRMKIDRLLKITNEYQFNDLVKAVYCISNYAKEVNEKKVSTKSNDQGRAYEYAWMQESESIHSIITSIY